MERAYIEVPGSVLHELPPLLVHGIPEDASRSELVERAAAMVETEDMIADSTPDVMEHRKLDLALHLTDQYFGLLSHWAWGDSVLDGAAIPQYFLNLASLPGGPLFRWASDMHLFRDLGAYWVLDDPDASLQPVELSRNYDGLFFVEEIHVGE